MGDEEVQQKYEKCTAAKVKRKKMTSILPDHLEVIEENDEEEMLYELDSISSGASSSATSHISRKRSILVDSSHNSNFLSQNLLVHDSNHSQVYPEYMKATKYVTHDDSSSSTNSSRSFTRDDSSNSRSSHNKVTRSRSSISIVDDENEDEYDDSEIFKTTFDVPSKNVGGGEASSEGTSKTVETDDCTDDGCSQSSHTSTNSNDLVEEREIEATLPSQQTNGEYIARSNSPAFESSSSSESSSSESSYRLAIDYGLEKQNVDQTKLWESANCNDSVSSNYNYDDDTDYVVKDEKDESCRESKYDPSFNGENNKPHSERKQATEDKKAKKRNLISKTHNKNDCSLPIMSIDDEEPTNTFDNLQTDFSNVTATYERDQSKGNEIVSIKENTTICQSKESNQRDVSQELLNRGSHPSSETLITSINGTSSSDSYKQSGTTYQIPLSGHINRKSNTNRESGRSSGSVSSRQSTTSSSVSMLSLSDHDKSLHNIDEEDDEIPWRMDPGESLSDWILNVKVKATDEVQTYNVHKNFLCLGPRKSEYLLNIVKDSKQHPELQSKVVELELLHPAANAIPLVLDYIYVDKLTLTSQNALALRYLSQVLGIKLLFQKVMDFIQRDLSIQAITIYYVTSTQLGDQKIRAVASRHCARNILKIDESHPLLKYMDPYFFSSILAIVGADDSVKRQLHASLLVAEYCKIQKDLLPFELFSMITNDQNLQSIHYSAAVTFLEIVSHLEPSELANPSNGPYNSIRERSISALARKWKLLCDKDPEQMISACERLPSTIITEVLIRSLQETKGTTRKKRLSISSTYSGCSTISGAQTIRSGNTIGHHRSNTPLKSRVTREDESKENRHSSDLSSFSSHCQTRSVASRRKLQHTKDMEQKTKHVDCDKHTAFQDDGVKRTQSFSSDKKVERKNEVHSIGLDTNVGGVKTSKSSEEYEAEILRLQETCSTKDREIDQLKSELQRFHRLENKPSGKLVKSSAKAMPSALPASITSQVEGHILSISTDKKYPLFYYKVDS